MIKMLVALTSLIGLTSATTPLFNNQVFNPQAIENFRPAKEWQMNENIVEKEMGPGEALTYVVTTVDLSTLGIKDHHDFLHYYAKVTIPGLSIKYNDKEKVTEDIYSWKVADLSCNSNEHWSNVFNKYDEEANILLDRSYYYTYATSDRHLILRLTYRASMVVENTTGTTGGKLSFARGTNVHIQ